MRETPPTRLLRRSLGCLIKVPLGCMAFVAGGTLVAAIFLPPVLGGLAVRAVGDRFEASHGGRLVVERATLGAVFDEQAIEGLALYDPDGREVLRGSLWAPSLGSLFGDGEFGPVEVHLEELRVERAADGSTNLERAIACADPREDWRREFEGDWNIDTGRGRRELDVDVVVEHLEWSDADGRRVEIVDLVAVLRLVFQHDRVALRLDGEASVLDAVTAERSPLVFSGQNADLARRRGESDWNLSIQGGPAPTALPMALIDSTAELETLFGERIERFELDLWREPRGERRIRLRIDSEQTSASLAATWPEGLEAFVGGPDDVCHLEFAPGSPVAHRALAEVVPLVQDLRLPEFANTTLMLSEFTLPFDGRLERFEGRGIFVTDRVTYSLEDVPRLRFRSKGREELPSTSLEVRFDGHRVLYDRFQMPAGNVMLRLNGEYDLAEKVYRLEVKPPGVKALHLRGQRGNVEVE